MNCAYLFFRARDVIDAGGILGGLSERRSRLLFSGEGGNEERQEQGSQGGEVRGKRGKNKGEVRGKERLENDSPSWTWV